MSDKKPAAFGNDALRKQLSQWKTEKTQAVKPPEPIRPPPPTARPAAPTSDDEGDALFRMVMDDVKPIVPSADPVSGESSPNRIAEDAEVLASLAELVANAEGLDIVESEEAIEGIAPGGDHGLFKALIEGHFPIRATLDMRGLRAEAARTKLDEFMAQSRKNGLRCVRIHPSSDLNVIVRWLSKGKLSRIVLAFRIALGGDGAMLVLLRR